MTFFLEINSTTALSEAYPSDIVMKTSKFLYKWATRIYGLLKSANSFSYYINLQFYVSFCDYICVSTLLYNHLAYFVIIYICKLSLRNTSCFVSQKNVVT